MREPGAGAESPASTIPIEEVRCREDHIRKSSVPLGALAETIVDAGLLQPILVSRAQDGSYSVIDGSRRLAALRELGVRELILGRDVVLDTEEREADIRFKQVIANVQREDLNPVELGQAFVTLKEEYGYQYNEIAEIIGKTQHYVAAKVGLIKRLDPQVQRWYLEDSVREKCNQSTSPDDRHPYVMNLNVVEDIARVPAELQKDAYEMIRKCEMDKDTAIGHLRTLKGKSQSSGSSRSESVVMSAEGKREKVIMKSIRRIVFEIGQLSVLIQEEGQVEADIRAEIEGLIGRLNSLCSTLKPKEVACPEKVAEKAGGKVL